MAFHNPFNDYNLNIHTNLVYKQETAQVGNMWLQYLWYEMNETEHYDLSREVNP